MKIDLDFKLKGPNGKLKGLATLDLPTHRAISLVVFSELLRAQPNAAQEDRKMMVVDALELGQLLIEGSRGRESERTHAAFDQAEGLAPAAAQDEAA